VELAQARRSRLGERVISLRRVTLAWVRPQTEGNSQSERIIAQARLFRLDESASRSSEISSPRRDLVQWQWWIYGIFAQVRTARLGEIIKIPICFHMQSHIIHIRNPTPHNK